MGGRKFRGLHKKEDVGWYICMKQSLETNCDHADMPEHITRSLYRCLGYVRDIHQCFRMTCVMLYCYQESGKVPIHFQIFYTSSMAQFMCVGTPIFQNMLQFGNLFFLELLHVYYFCVHFTFETNAKGVSQRF